MPIYEYQCSDCGHTFERLESFQERPGAICPECGKPAEKVLSSSVGYVIKGANYPGGGQGAREGSCCGQSSPCANPKRCCGK